MAESSVVWAPVQESWFRDVNRLTASTPWLHSPMRLYAEYGVILFAALLMVAWWLARRDNDLARVAMAVWAPVGVLVALGINQFISAGIAEPRPYVVFPHAVVLVHRTGDFSFPSDHAVMAGAVAAGIFFSHRGVGLAAGALALLMAFSRVYVGAHFPLDVAFGLLVGAGVAMASYVLAAPYVVRLLAALRRTPLRVMITSVDPGALASSER